MYNKKSIMEKYYEEPSVPPPTEQSASPPTEQSASPSKEEPLPDNCNKDNRRWVFCNNALKGLPNDSPIPEDWFKGGGCHGCPLPNPQSGQKILDDTLPLPDNCNKDNRRWIACNKSLALNGIWDEKLWNSGEVCNHCPKTDTPNQRLSDVIDLPSNNRTEGQSCRLQNQCSKTTTCTDHKRCITTSKIKKIAKGGKCTYNEECINGGCHGILKYCAN